MTRPRLLDLFCGAGGCSVGYHRAGFDVVGVDMEPMPRYPFEFRQADALDVLAGVNLDLRPDQFDAIHASPPCQAYSVATATLRATGTEYPNLLAPTRALLERTGLPWVIENVPGAPMRADYRLCGCMFDLPLLRRERWFETSWRGFSLRSPCHHDGPALSVTGNGVGGGNGQRGRLTAHLGHAPTIHDSRTAMGIDWMTITELSQAIPPAYTEYIGAQLIEQMEVAA